MNFIKITLKSGVEEWVRIDSIKRVREVENDVIIFTEDGAGCRLKDGLRGETMPVWLREIGLGTASVEFQGEWVE